MKAWECSACGGKSFTRLNATTIMCDYCETRFTLEDSEQQSTSHGSAELRHAKGAALLAKALPLHDQGKYHEEIDILLQALELDEENSDIWINLGRAYRMTSLYDDALRCYQRAMEITPNNGVVYGNIGVVYQLKGDYTSAVRYLKRALTMVEEKNASYAVIMANLAIAMYKSGNHAEGIRLIDEAERRGYANADAARKQMGISKGVSKEDKLQAEVLREKAQKIYKEKQYAQALQLLQQAIKLDPEDSFLWTSLGRAYNVNDDPDEALRCHKRALELDPNNGTAYGNIGLILHNKGNYKEAIRHYYKGLALLPSNTPDHWTIKANLAISTYMNGDKKNGIRLLEEAERLGYRNGNAVRNMLGIKKSGFLGLFK